MWNANSILYRKLVYIINCLYIYFILNLPYTLPRTKAITSDSVKNTAELIALIIDSITDIKGKNIVQLDLRHLPDAQPVIL